MTDDQSPPRSPFSWGLRPSGEPEEPRGGEPADGTPADDASADDAAADDAAAVDRGEFLALPLASESAGDSMDDWEGEPTAAFDFQAPPPPASTVPTAVYHEGPTLPWEHPAAFDPALAGATESVGAQEAGIDRPVDESAPTNAMDALFGAEQFQEYEDAPAQPLVKSLVPAAPSKELLPVAAPRPPKTPKPPKGPRGPLPRSQRIGVWVAGGLVAVLGLTGLYFVGTRIPDAPQQAAPVASAPPTPTATEAPVEPVAAIGPVAPGVHEWDELLGTECVEPFATAWEQEYTVVDCAEPHSAQLVYRGRFDDSATDAYPGVEALQSRMNLLCTSPENIDYATASQVNDIQFMASFAGTEADWADGNRAYFCFVNRASGEALTMNVATAPRAPVAIPVAPAPEP